MKYQLVLVSFVIAIGHGLDGDHWFLDGGWWLGVDFFAEGWVSSTPYAGNGPVADVAGPAVL